VVGYYNAQWLPGSLINRDLRKVVGTVSAALDIRGRQLRGEMYAAAKAHLEPIWVDSHILFNPQVNYLYFLLTTLLPTMLQLFILLVSTHSLGVELKEGSAGEWLEAAGHSVWRALVGKLLPYTVHFLVLGLFMNTLLFGYLGVPERGSLLLIGIGTVLFVLAYQAMGIAFSACTANLRLSTSLVAFYSGAAFAFTGVTFPTMAMPLMGKVWGELLPLTHYLRLLIQQAIRGAPCEVSVPALLALLAFVVLAPLLSIRRMGRLIDEPEYWGRT
jgi:ABC-2 type transport system permease protein